MTDWSLLEEGKRKGKRYERWHEVHCPPELVTGHYERMSALAIREVIKDLQAEEARRGRVPEVEPIALPTTRPSRALLGYDPMKSQFRGDLT